MTLIMDSHPYFNRVICGKKQMYKSSEKEKKNLQPLRVPHVSSVSKEGFSIATITF